MNILMVGTGYVGLVTATCLAQMGHQVICLDVNAEKIEQLKQGSIPFYEPGLQEMVMRNAVAGRLSFTTSYSEGVRASQVCFIAVPTPSLEEGGCDLSYVLSAARTVAQHMDTPKIIVNKSTSPVGTTAKIHAEITAILRQKEVEIPFDVVSNPEFLKEGCAIHDCMKPDRIILGVHSPHSAKVLKELYAPFNVSRDRILVMDPLSAEMTKYAANAMLALRISFMNELSHLCEATGANIRQIRLGIGADQRIGHQFLYAGVGYGGSCFPKDIRALCSLAKQEAIPTPLLEAIEETNERQKKHLVAKVCRYFVSRGGIEGKKLAIWGLSFKPDTDDIREAPSLTVIPELLAAGAFVSAYDPVAIPNASLLLSHPHLTFTDDEYSACQGADAILLLTEWKQFRSVDFHRLLKEVNTPVLFDGRNQYDPDEMRSLGFTYLGVGIPSCLEATLSSLQTTLYNAQAEHDALQ